MKYLMVKRYDTLIGCAAATLPYQTMKVITHLLNCIRLWTHMYVRGCNCVKPTGPGQPYLEM